MRVEHESFSFAPCKYASPILVMHAQHLKPAAAIGGDGLALGVVGSERDASGDASQRRGVGLDGKAEKGQDNDQVEHRRPFAVRVSLLVTARCIW